MAEIITLQIPKRITHNSTSELTSTFFATDLNRNPPTKIIYDISHLEYFDTEGMGYLALLPFHLKLFCKDIEIVLPPPGSRVASFFAYTRLLEILVENFPTPGIRIPEDYNFLHERYARNSKSIKSNIDVFKKDSFINYILKGMELIQDVVEKRDFSNYFNLCFYELTQNIFEHSGETMGSFAFQYRKGGVNSPGSNLEVSITDIGIGVKDSLMKNNTIDQNENDIYYLIESIKRGISGTSEIDRGIGLHDVINYNSKVQITSGGGVLQTIDGKIQKADNLPYSRKGTSVFISLPL